MKNKINVAELLKDCPRGMELDCAMFENVFLERVDKNVEYPIAIRVGKTDVKHLTKEGCWNKYSNAKCVIFPKGKTTWEGFFPPCNFKNGDIVYTNGDSIAILSNGIGMRSGAFNSCCGLYNHEFDTDVVVSPKRFATEEEKQILFSAIKANGYCWNEKTKTLEKFSKFKDGDIVACDSFGGAQVFIFKEYKDIENDYAHCYMMLDNDGAVDFEHGFYYVERFATEEETKKLLDTINARGLQWDEETKALEVLLKPKFKVGDKIRSKENHNYIYTITGIREKENKYECGVTFVLRFSEQDNWELVPDKFDITNLKPFDKVLVRLDNANQWYATWFSHIDERQESFCRRYVTVSGKSYTQIIPYKGNEHLCGTKNNCDEYFKNW